MYYENIKWTKVEAGHYHGATSRGHRFAAFKAEKGRQWILRDSEKGLTGRFKTLKVCKEVADDLAYGKTLHEMERDAEGITVVNKV